MKLINQPIHRGGGYSSKEENPRSLTNKAFTLIELLVVIAIIGILASVVIASLNSARAKARDAKRVSDIRAVQTALEMYYADNGTYPGAVGTPYANAGNATCYQYTGAATDWGTPFDASFRASYLNQLPTDPSGPSTEWCYTYFKPPTNNTGTCGDAVVGDYEYILTYRAEGNLSSPKIANGYRYCVLGPAR